MEDKIIIKIADKEVKEKIAYLRAKNINISMLICTLIKDYKAEKL